MNNCLPVLEMKGITKRFGGTLALDGVNLQLHRGEVLGLVGENGAGKSTLVKILCGAHVKDEGEIFLNGNKIERLSTDYSQKLGISIIYQELSLFADFNAVENIFIHREIAAGKGNMLLTPLNRKQMKKRAWEILKNDLSAEIDLDKPVRDLSLAQRQIIEIARILTSDPQIIIMDEPTTTLVDAERENLFRVIARLKKSGHSIVYISHALEEVLQVCDNVMVLRDGKEVAHIDVKDIDVNSVINIMIGKTLKQQYPKEKVTQGECLLSVQNLTKASYFEDISFQLHQGEIIGIAGLEGCGKSEIVRALFGSIHYDHGKVMIRNKEVKYKGIIGAMSNGLAFLPADRKTEGLFLAHDVKLNTTIAHLKKLSNVFINRKKEKEYTTSFIRNLEIKTSSMDQAVGSLSGGNQQKVMIARWLLTSPDIILLEEPTRGIDVNAKAEVYKLIMQFVKEGKAVVIVSSEGPELLGICDRIIVMYERKISKVLIASETDEKTLAYYSVHSVGE